MRNACVKECLVGTVMVMYKEEETVLSRHGLTDWPKVLIGLSQGTVGFIVIYLNQDNIN